MSDTPEDSQRRKYIEQLSLRRNISRMSPALIGYLLDRHKDQADHRGPTIRTGMNVDRTKPRRIPSQTRTANTSTVEPPMASAHLKYEVMPALHPQSI